MRDFSNAFVLEPSGTGAAATVGDGGVRSFGRVACVASLVVTADVDGDGGVAPLLVKADAEGGEEAGDIEPCETFPEPGVGVSGAVLSDAVPGTSETLIERFVLFADGGVRK